MKKNYILDHVFDFITLRTVEMCENYIEFWIIHGLHKIEMMQFLICIKFLFSTII